MHSNLQLTVGSRRVVQVIGLALCASTAQAQSFNIDLGSGLAGTVPTPAYGAAAAQPGMWNDVPANGNQPLMDLSGAVTAVNINALATGNFFFDNDGTTGDDQASMDDIQDLPTTLTVSGLAPGSYTIYTYAWAPDDPIHITNVVVTGSTDPLQACGGMWPGAQVLGITYTRHALVIGPGQLDLMITFTLGGGQFVSANGVQIVSGSSGGVGTNYCGPGVVNSTGNSGSISGTGTSVVSNNDLGLVADDLPMSAFGYFLTSRTQGLVNQPGGSLGVLCLGGAIGRYTGAGQILNTGATNSFSLALNLNQTPTPTGLVAVVAGETWNFQAWHRDAVGGVAVSNFTNGLSVTFQ
jgi:hypothetical protein